MSAVRAHDGAPLAPHDLAGAWNLDLVLVLVVAVTALVYVRAVRRWWSEAGRGSVVTGRQVVAFGAAMGCLVLALVSPLDTLSGALFSAHMVQHLLLTLVAAPLLLVGRAHVAVVAVLPVSLRRRWGRRLARGLRRAGPRALVAAVAIHVITVLVWHAPALYDLAAATEWVHITEHATMLLSGMVFWAAMGAARPRPVAAAGLAAFVASLAFTLLAALLTTAGAPWYGAHVGLTSGFGLTALEDQQLAAAIMWVPGGIVYLGAAAAAIVRWIRADERELAARRSPAYRG